MKSQKKGEKDQKEKAKKGGKKRTLTKARIKFILFLVRLRPYH